MAVFGAAARLQSEECDRGRLYFLDTTTTLMEVEIENWFSEFKEKRKK